MEKLLSLNDELQLLVHVGSISEYSETYGRQLGGVFNNKGYRDDWIEMPPCSIPSILRVYRHKLRDNCMKQYSCVMQDSHI